MPRQIQYGHPLYSSLPFLTLCPSPSKPILRLRPYTMVFLNKWGRQNNLPPEDHDGYPSAGSRRHLARTGLPPVVQTYGAAEAHRRERYGMSRGGYRQSNQDRQNSIPHVQSGPPLPRPASPPFNAPSGPSSQRLPDRSSSSQNNSNPSNASASGSSLPQPAAPTHNPPPAPGPPPRPASISGPSASTSQKRPVDIDNGNQAIKKKKGHAAKAKKKRLLEEFLRDEDEYDGVGEEELWMNGTIPQSPSSPDPVPVDIKPDIAALQQADETPSVPIEQREEGTVYVPREMIPVKCYLLPNGAAKNSHRTAFKSAQVLELKERGMKVTTAMWRSDGLGLDWVRVAHDGPSAVSGEGSSERDITEETTVMADENAPEARQTPNPTGSNTVAAADGPSNPPPTNPAQPTSLEPNAEDDILLSQTAEPTLSIPHITPSSIPLDLYRPTPGMGQILLRNAEEIEAFLEQKMERISIWTRMYSQRPSHRATIEMQINRLESQIFELSDELERRKRSEKAAAVDV